MKGHGGADPGAVGGTGVQEKVVTLKVVHTVGKILGEAGCNVVYTRPGDVSVELHERANTANKHNADVFVSVHCNAANNPAAHGLEAFYFWQAGGGKRLADGILDKLAAETGLGNRGTKEAGFAVLRLTDMPAALIECGFITNPTEEALLESGSFQEKCARAIAGGIADFLGVHLRDEEQVPAAQAAFEKLAEKAKFNQLHEKTEPVTLELLAVVLERLGIIA